MPHAHVTSRPSSLRRALPAGRRPQPDAPRDRVCAVLPVCAGHPRQDRGQVAAPDRRREDDGTPRRRAGGDLHRRRSLRAPEFELVLGAAPARSVGDAARRAGSAAMPSSTCPRRTPRRPRRRASPRRRRRARTNDLPQGRRPRPTDSPAVREAALARPVVFSDVVLNFQFGRSELTDEAKDKLASAISIPKANARMMSIALEGHADWTGPEGYNERLGLARAESVRRYMAEQLQIPADRISVVSYGETQSIGPEHDAGRSRRQPSGGDQGGRVAVDARRPQSCLIAPTGSIRPARQAGISAAAVHAATTQQQARRVGDRVEQAHGRPDLLRYGRRQERGAERGREAAAEEQAEADRAGPAATARARRCCGVWRRSPCARRSPGCVARRDTRAR